MDSFPQLVGSASCLCSARPYQLHDINNNSNNKYNKYNNILASYSADGMNGQFKSVFLFVFVVASAAAVVASASIIFIIIDFLIMIVQR